PRVAGRLASAGADRDGAGIRHDRAQRHPSCHRSRSHDCASAIILRGARGRGVDPDVGECDAPDYPGRGPARSIPQPSTPCGAHRTPGMTTRVLQSAVGSKHTHGRERMGVLAVAGLIITGIGTYWVMNTTIGSRDTRGLLSYQSLVRMLPEGDQQMFRTI